MDWKSIARNLFGQDGAAIRPMRPADLDEVLRIIRLHDSDDYKAAKAAFSDARFDLPEETTAHFVIIEPEERRPVGVSGYYIDDLEAKGLYWLGWTYVNPFMRGRGYGGQLMEFVLEAVRRQGGRKIYLSTSSLGKYAAAVGFYERYGFVEEGRLRDYYSDGEHQLILGRRVDDGGATTSASTRRRQRQSAPATPERSEQAPPTSQDEVDEDQKGDDGVVFDF